MIKNKSYSLILVLFVVFSRAQVDSTAAKELNNDSTANKFNIPIFSTSGGEADSDMDQQDVSSLLMSSRDVFTQFASFQWGVARYRMRGYMAENQQVMINGVNVNNLETGFSAWSNWGGLNNVTRFVETRVGNVANRLGFSGPGGYTNIDSKASSFRKGSNVSYAFANRIFRNRFMATTSTGMMENGWAFTLSASSRTGNQVYIPGTYFDASAYYISVDKNFHDKHLLSFTGFVAPVEQGRAGAAQLEAYELTDNHYYNPLWGYQNGKVRNASVTRTTRPMLMLTHQFNIGPSEHLTSSVFANFGKAGFTGLNWNDAPNPRPDYYRYLPSYYYMSGDTAMGNTLKNNWQNNPDATAQINWDRIIAMNQANLYSDPSQVGQTINTTETRARYILENRIENLMNIGLNTVYNKRIDQLFISAGLNANVYKNRKYKELEDLLGATFWIDVDQFAENLGVDETFQQNDIDNPNRKVYQGDKFGYDYSININRAEVWGQAEYTFSKFDVYGGLTISNSQVWREGYLANGKFPTSSKGKSEVLNFLNYGVKGGITYKINGRNFLTANGSYLTRTPEANNIFISPRVRNDAVSGVTNEKVLSGDVNYLAKFPTFKLRATLYYTKISDQTWLRSYWHDEYNNNVNYIMTDVDQTHAGVELGVEKILFVSHTIQGAFGFGQFVYNNRPIAQAYQDNNNVKLFDNRTVYLVNYRMGNGPQMAAGLGYTYNGKKFWYAGLNFNYFDKIYIEPNPDRRTQESGGKFQENELEQAQEIIGQEQLPAYFLLNANAGKSFRIAGKYFLRFNATINNILNNKNIISGGFEQLRWDMAVINKFPNKYYYMLGTTYMLSVNFSF